MHLDTKVGLPDRAPFNDIASHPWTAEHQLGQTFPSIHRVACERSCNTRLSGYRHAVVFDRISIDPAVRFGKPCVRGTRVTVGEVLGLMAQGQSPEELVGEYPQLTVADVRQCLAFAAERERRIIINPMI